MFKEKFTRLCIEKGESPSAVCVKLGLSNAIYSKWDENSVPRKSTLIKFADYFGVDVSYFDEKEGPPGEIPEGLDKTCAKIITIYSNLEENQKSEALSYLEFLVQKKKQDN